MKSISQKLIESFEDLFEAPVNATGYDPEKVQYAYQDGKANQDWPGNNPPPDQKTDQTTTTTKDKPVPQKSKLFDPSVQTIQNLFNKLGITDNAGAKISPDGVWGWRTEEAKHNFYKKYKRGSAEEKQVQDLANKVKPEFQWRLIADRNGRSARGGADMSKPKDPAIGEPSPAALKAMGLSVDGQGTQNNAAAGDAKSKAMQISQAISGPGTDEDAVYAVIDTVKTPEEFNQIATAYKTIWGGRRELGAELLGDFSGIDLVQLNQRFAKIGLVLSADGQVVSKVKAESTEIDLIRKLSGLK